MMKMEAEWLRELYDEASNLPPNAKGDFVMCEIQKRLNGFVNGEINRLDSIEAIRKFLTPIPGQMNKASQEFTTLKRRLTLLEKKDEELLGKVESTSARIKKGSDNTLERFNDIDSKIASMGDKAEAIGVDLNELSESIYKQMKSLRERLGALQERVDALIRPDVPDLPELPHPPESILSMRVADFLFHSDGMLEYGRAVSAFDKLKRKRVVEMVKVTRDKFLSVKNIGICTLMQVEKALGEYGLRLGMSEEDIKEWSRSDR